MIKISVIIPVYNVEKYLRECLDSVINQTLKDIEIICIDDGSKDNSLSILKEYAQKDSRIKIINQENNGAGSARNNGIDNAKGEYLYFLDSDDYIDKTLLEKTYQRIVTTNSDICVFKNSYYDDSKKSWFVNEKMTKKTKYVKNKTVFSRKNFPKKLYQLFTVPAYTKLYRTNFIKENNIYFQEIKTCNDVFFNFYTLAKAEKITFLDENLVTYRIAQTDNLSAKRYKSVHCIKLAFDALKERLIKDNLFIPLKTTYYKAFCQCAKYEIGLLPTEDMKKEQAIKILEDVPKRYWPRRFKKYYQKEFSRIINSLIDFIFKKDLSKDKRHTIYTILGIKFSFKKYPTIFLFDENSIKEIKNYNYLLKNITISPSNKSNIVKIHKNLLAKNIKIRYSSNATNCECILDDSGNTGGLDLEVMFMDGKNSKLTIGKNTGMNGTKIWLGNGSQCYIGNNCLFSYETIIRTTDGHTIFDLNTNEVINNQKNPCIIKDHCWIGLRTIINKNAQIAENTIVGSGSVVTKKFDTPNIIIGGNPAKILRENVSFNNKNIYNYNKSNEISEDFLITLSNRSRWRN